MAIWLVAQVWGGMVYLCQELLRDRDHSDMGMPGIKVRKSKWRAQEKIEEKETTQPIFSFHAWGICKA